MALNEKNSDKILNSNLDLLEFSLDGNSAKESEKLELVLRLIRSYQIYIIF